MKKFKIIVAISFLALIFFGGCKKYPNDEALMHWKTVKKRICQTWKVERFEIDGADSVQLIYNSDTLVKDKLFVVEFTKVDNKGTFIGEWMTYATFTFELLEHKKTLLINWKHQPNNFVKGYTSKLDYEWEIVRLDNNDLWLKQIIEGKTYVSKFKSYKS